MEKINILLLLIVLPLSVQSQIPWNDPPEYYFYTNQNRWVEIILPTPQNLTASMVNNNQVVLKWNEYWTDNFKVHYKNRFGYEAIPNRFSFYRQNITDGGNLEALVGIEWEINEYVDATVEFGKEYMYKFLASDLNYLTVGGWQHWSTRSDPAFVTIGIPSSSLSYPTNFHGQNHPNSLMIILSWDKVNDANSYTIYKSYTNPDNGTWVHLAIPVGNVTEYNDTDIVQNMDYYYSIIASNNNNHSSRSPTIVGNYIVANINAPTGFVGYYEPDSAAIMLYWNYNNNATSYTIYKSYTNPDNGTWVHLAIPVGNVNHYFDTNLLQYVGYVYTIIVINGNTSSNRTDPLTISSGTLSIDTEEYWEAVEEYEKDRKFGWFGCSLNK